MDDLRYPVGRFDHDAPITADMRGPAVETIAALPRRMRAAVAGLSDAQLDTPYRDGGWTVRQVVHHVPDSHVNAYIRLKLALTEDVPTVKPYDEDAWSKLADARMPIEPSLKLLDGVHERWVTLLRALRPEDWQRQFHHPEYTQGPRTIDWLAQSYAWHSRHHLAHITSLLDRRGWAKP